MPKRNLKRSYSRAFSRSRSRSKSSRIYRAPTKKVKRTSLARQIGIELGGIAGSLIPAVGSKVGKRLTKHMINSVWGHGDYYMGNPVNNNSLTKLSDGTTPPQFSSTSRNTCIKHREYIKDISSSRGFRIEQFEINPGLLVTFPWLSSVAKNYECWRVKGMLFEFKSMSADALTSTNTALGTVIMATQYNAAADPFSSKQQMENYEFAQSCKPSQSMLHYIECARNQTPINELYVRTGATPPSQPQQLYDIGDFYIATQGMQEDNVNIGELWVTYDIEFFKPKLVAQSTSINAGFWQVRTDNASNASNPFSQFVSPISRVFQHPDNNMDCRFGGPTTFIIQNGEEQVGKCYLIQMIYRTPVNGAGSGWPTDIAFEFTGCQQVYYFPAGNLFNATWYQYGNATTKPNQVFEWVIKCNAPVARTELRGSWPVYPGCHFVVTELPAAGTNYLIDPTTT